MDNQIQSAMSSETKPAPSPTASGGLLVAKALYDARQYNLSEAEFKRLLESGNQVAECNYYLGLIRYVNGDSRGASEYLSRATTLDPKNANAFFYLGETARVIGDPGRARDFYQKALLLNPAHQGAIKMLQSLSVPGAVAPMASSSPTPAPVSTPKSELSSFFHILTIDPAPLSQDSVRLIRSLQERIKDLKPRSLSYVGRWMLRFVICGFISGVCISLATAIQDLERSSVAPTTTTTAATMPIVQIPGLASLAGGLPLMPILLLAAFLIVQPPKLMAYLRLQPCESSFLRLFGFACFFVAAIFVSNKSRDIVVAVAGTMISASILYCFYYAIWMDRIRYSFNEGRFLISRGVFTRELKNIELYRVMDLEINQSVFNRFTKDGSIMLFVEGVDGNREAVPIELTGIAKIQDLRLIFEDLRNLIILLRSSSWGKGVIY